MPPADQAIASDLTIIFQATRVGASTVDYSNSLCKIHVNNYSEVNNLWFEEFGLLGCCTPIDAALLVEFTVDHEEMGAGDWTLSIDSCSPSAPGNIKPTNPTPGVTFTPSGRGASGTIHEDTTAWCNCSYQVWLNTRPGLTTGLNDRDWVENLLTFCICGHAAVVTLAAAITTVTQTSITVTSNACFETIAAPFSVSVGGTGEMITVTAVSGTTWTVQRGQGGTTAAKALAGATLTQT